ncbi:MAG: hypothetical protein Q7J68_03575 [Thermoplasmata archaeon]|nr:hypothetical protein [Thermoplasmata archaeon]
MKKKDSKQEPIYEKLAPGEVLIISKDEDGCLQVAENVNGKIKLKKICAVEA